MLGLCSLLAGQLVSRAHLAVRLDRLPDASITLHRVVPMFRRKVLYLVRAAAPRPIDARSTEVPF